jgi:hypothetical protein
MIEMLKLLRNGLAACGAIGAICYYLPSYPMELRYVNQKDIPGLPTPSTWIMYKRRVLWSPSGYYSGRTVNPVCGWHIKSSYVDSVNWFNSWNWGRVFLAALRGKSEYHALRCVLKEHRLLHHPSIRIESENLLAINGKSYYVHSIICDDLVHKESNRLVRRVTLVNETLPTVIYEIDGDVVKGIKE